MDQTGPADPMDISSRINLGFAQPNLRARLLPPAAVWLFTAWLIGAGPLSAQPSPPPNPAESNMTPSSTSTDVSSASSTAAATSTAEGGAPCRGWARVDYLLWWVKNSPLPVPVVTTGDPRVGFDPNFVNTVDT